LFFKRRLALKQLHVFQLEYGFHCKPDRSTSSYTSAVYPTSYPVAAAGYPGVYCDFGGLYPYPVAYWRAYDDDDAYYAHDRKYTEATQRLRWYGVDGAASRSAYELSPSPPSPEVASGHQRAPAVPSSCRLAVTSSGDKTAPYVDPFRAETSIPEVAAGRSCAYGGYTGNGNPPRRAQQRGRNSTPTAHDGSPSSSSSSSVAADSGGLHRSAASAAAASSPVNLAGEGGGHRWTVERRSVITAETAGSGSGGGVGGQHQSVIRRTGMHDPPPTVADSLTTAVRVYSSDRETSAVDEVRRPAAGTSAVRDHFKAATQSFYYASQPDHTADDGDEAHEEYSSFSLGRHQHLPVVAGARSTYFRVGGQQQQRLQHHVPTGNHVTGYTSVIVDTQQLHANGYVH